MPKSDSVNLPDTLTFLLLVVPLRSNILNLFFLFPLLYLRKFNKVKKEKSFPILASISRPFKILLWTTSAVTAILIIASNGFLRFLFSYGTLNVAFLYSPFPYTFLYFTIFPFLLWIFTLARLFLLSLTVLIEPFSYLIRFFKIYFVFFLGGIAFWFLYFFFIFCSFIINPYFIFYLFIYPLPFIPK